MYYLLYSNFLCVYVQPSSKDFIECCVSCVTIYEGRSFNILRRGQKDVLRIGYTFSSVVKQPFFPRGFVHNPSFCVTAAEYLFSFSHMQVFCFLIYFPGGKPGQNIHFQIPLP